MKKRSKVTKVVEPPPAKPGGAVKVRGKLNHPLLPSGKRPAAEFQPPPPPVKEFVPSVPMLKAEPPKFVPPTDPPEFAVEQAVQLLARRIVRDEWQAAGRRQPQQLELGLAASRMNDRVFAAARRLAGLPNG
jgi:hypothetical protein